MSLKKFNQDFPRLCANLLGARLNSRTAHAYLLTGDDSEYLEAFARSWAMACACLSPETDGDACGHCRSCTAIGKNIYTDMQVLRPRSKSRQIVMEDMHEFERVLGLTAARDNVKLGIIIDADRMNASVQNAFLKTLEEPSAKTMLLLLTTQPARLLTTIRSRCQCISMMRNLTDCSFAQERGLFEVLHDLVPNAGAATALRCAARLSDIFAEIRDTARQNVADMKNGGLSRDQYDLLERTQKKRLEDEDKAREQAEYMSLQNKLLAGIQTWFQQQILIAAGIPRAILPLPLPEETSGIQVSQDAAENAARLVDELIRHLEANVYEPLALDAFCLEVCEKRLV